MAPTEPPEVGSTEPLAVLALPGERLAVPAGALSGWPARFPRFVRLARLAWSVCRHRLRTACCPGSAVAGQLLRRPANRVDAPRQQDSRPEAARKRRPRSLRAWLRPTILPERKRMLPPWRKLPALLPRSAEGRRSAGGARSARWLYSARRIGRERTIRDDARLPAEAAGARGATAETTAKEDRANENRPALATSSKGSSDTAAAEAKTCFGSAPTPPQTQATPSRKP